MVMALNKQDMPKVIFDPRDIVFYSLEGCVRDGVFDSRWWGKKSRLVSFLATQNMILL